MLKYVVEYVFFERARVWMYLLCDDFFLRGKFCFFFAGVPCPDFSFFSPFLERVFFIFVILNPK